MVCHKKWQIKKNVPIEETNGKILDFFVFQKLGTGVSKRTWYVIDEMIRTISHVMKISRLLYGASYKNIGTSIDFQWALLLHSETLKSDLKLIILCKES
jgi:hypothetical protein